MNDNNNSNNNANIFNEDHTSEFTQADINSGKLMSILSYISILVLIPFLTEKRNKYVIFHAKQGMNLFIYEAILYMIDTVTDPFLPALSFFAYVLELVLFVYSLVGIIYVVSNTARDLPYLNKIKIVK